MSESIFYGCYCNLLEVLYIFLYIYLGFSEKLPVIQFPCWIARTVFGDLFPNTCQATNTKRLQEKATDFIIL